MRKASTRQRRSYQQYCGIARALDVVGERWTLLIVRNLLLGPQRYSDLLRSLPGITTNLLAKRLREMEGLELIARTDDGSAYRLRPRGAALEPAIHALGKWGWGSSHMKSPVRGEYVSFDFLAVALRRRYRQNATLRAEIVADGVPYRLMLTKHGADVTRGDMPSPDVRLSGPGASLARVFLDEAARKRIPNDVSAEGSPEAVRTLLGAFSPTDD
jgi:DNA-binding HxlR family transcriptional regulator